MDDNELRTLVIDAAVEEDGRRKLACVRAFKLAAEHDAALADIGRICNEEGIRICRCQLGCFR